MAAFEREGGAARTGRSLSKAKKAQPGRFLAVLIVRVRCPSEWQIKQKGGWYIWIGSALAYDRQNM